MEQVKITLSEAAEKKGCSIDYLLALAEAGRVDIFARIGPFTGTLGDMRGERLTPPQTYATNSPQYSALLPHEVALLRSGKSVTINLWREEGNEDGHGIPALSESPLFYWLAVPQTIGIEQVHLNESQGVRNVGVISETERDRLLKHIAGLALALAEKTPTPKYKRGGKPNASQIADTVCEILEALPDAHATGAGKSSIRDSIAEGLKLLLK